MVLAVMAVLTVLPAVEVPMDFCHSMTCTHMDVTALFVYAHAYVVAPTETL